MAKDKSNGPSRRAFLKTSGLAAVSTVFMEEGAVRAEHGTREASSANVPANAQVQRNPVDSVNILQGTASTPEFSRGNTLPIAALPFGMAHWTLQSHDDTPWMFQPGVRRIQGFRCTHQLSPWLSDYGHATFLPFRGEIHPKAAARASSYAAEQAHFGPHSLQLFLLRYRAHVELIPTERSSVLTATFEEDEADDEKTIGLLFDIPGDHSTIEPDPATQSIRFTSTANSGGVPDNFATYYLLQMKSPWDSFEVKEAGAHRVGILRYRQGLYLEAHIATSFISFEQAALNLRNEIGQHSPGDLRSSAAARWNDHLNRIEIEGASEEQRRTFYSCVYRVLLFPRTWHEPDAQGKMHHFSAFNGKVTPGVMYADHGYWDVYRAWYPLMSILFPERLGEILQAWVNAYKEGGWLPQFPCPGYRACMTGSLIDSVFGDAAVKRVKGFDLETAYEGLKKHATMPGDPDKGYGRVGLEQYLKLQYVPADRVPQSVAETVDAAYGDFCIAQVAKALGKEDDYAAFMKRSENWRHVYDPQVKFFRGKNEDGSWLTPFNPFTWGSPYVEGAAWQHRWDAPQNLPGLIEQIGGETEAAKALQDMLATRPVFHVGVYESEIHEMSEMAAVPFGQYAHSNQPVHHLLYILAHAGRPDLTQLWARKVMRSLYTPDTFAGDEDTGSMSAWFVLSALGFYPVCPGKPAYTLGSPLFARSVVHLPEGATFSIEAQGNASDAVYVRRASLDGKAVGSVIEHADIMKGGTLHFEMASSANGGNAGNSV
jgi:predicted alpha-1,2-mannosidase